jgi:hypothetical protein
MDQEMDGTFRMPPNQKFPILELGKEKCWSKLYKIVYFEPFLALQAEQSGNTLKNRSKKPFGPILGTFKYLQHYKNVITSPPLRGFTSVSLFVH